MCLGNLCWGVLVGLLANVDLWLVTAVSVDIALSKFPKNKIINVASKINLLIRAGGYWFV